jgi:transposase-like protein
MVAGTNAETRRLTMSRRHVCHTAEFKARVALAALADRKGSAELAREYGVTANQVDRWKGELIENAPRFFERDGMRGFDHEIEVIDLFHRLARLRGNGRICQARLRKRPNSSILSG